MLDPANPLERLAAAQARYRRSQARIVRWTIAAVVVILFCFVVMVSWLDLTWPVALGLCAVGVASGLLRGLRK